MILYVLYRLNYKSEIHMFPILWLHQINIDLYIQIIKMLILKFLFGNFYNNEIRFIAFYSNLSFPVIDFGNS